MHSSKPKLPADLAPLRDEQAPDPSESSIDPYQQASEQAKAAFAAGESAELAKNEQEAVDQYLRCAAAAEAAHEWYLVALACERVGEFLLSPKPPSDVKRAFRILRRSAAAYEQCGLYSEARSISYRVSSLRLWRFARNEITPLKRAELLLYWLTSGFGLRPLRVIGTALVAIAVYGLVYWLLGGAVDLQSGRHAGFIDSLYFSGITFATVGYGDLIPAAHARLIALTEGLLGAFLLGFFVVVLAHRLARI